MDLVTLWLPQTLHHEPRDLDYLGNLSYLSTHTHTDIAPWSVHANERFVSPIIFLCSVFPSWQVGLGIPGAVLSAYLLPWLFLFP